MDDGRETKDERRGTGDDRKEKIEAYIRDLSEAEITHGLCPDCMKKLYPEIANQNSKLKEG